MTSTASVVLSTAFALLALISCLLLVLRAARYADDARIAANELRAQRGVVSGHTTQIDALEHRLRKLSGTVYAARREERVVVDAELVDDGLTQEDRNRAIRERLRTQNGGWENRK